MINANHTITVQAVMLTMLARIFPAWRITVDDQGRWIAKGPTHVIATSCDLLAQALGDADPDAVERAVHKLHSLA
ncbi:hypothetical protein [Actinomadura rupiterrae]|uniref:hypothetical protein n=1 Tax=Actinomadura rupiterrae TaxID=559627 RepID=UPI0020A48201|nr:hypothetical protein [Actinomadura rupiterrae]MCP2341542.1 hypothetical protein [Actinomadura rupiterrae]